MMKEDNTMEDNEEKKEMLADTFPSNSRAPKPRPEPEKIPEGKKVEKIVTGKVKKQKRGFGKKVAETLCEDDTKSVGSYIVYDVLIPAAKDMLSDMVGGGIDMLLFGGEGRSRRRSSRGSGRGGYTSYGSYYRGNDRDRDRDRRDSRDRDRGREISNRGRARHDFDEVVIYDRGDAEEVLSRLSDFVVDYDVATVADFYDLVGITGSFTDNKWGWDDLHGVRVIRARGGGYVIDLPRPKPLD